MSRIALTTVDQQPEPIRQFIARRSDLNVFRLLANATHLFAGWTQMVDELFHSSTFSLRMKEIIILRVAHLQTSRYELNQHLGLSFAAAHAALGDEALTEALMILSCYYGLALVVNAVDLDVDTVARFQP